VRVVSLVPSVTETLLAWGVTPVAVTRFCEQPSLRSVGGTKDPDVDAIAALGPDLVVVNDEENRREDADALVSRGLAIHVVRIRSLGDVEPALRALGGAVGVDPRFDRADLTTPPPDRKAFVPIWRRPYMTLSGDTYGASLLATLGISTLFADRTERYPAVELESAAAERPDLVLAPSEPYPFSERHRAELERVAPVVLVDGRDLFWWGARSAAAQRRLRTTLAGARP
jgi:ABC-type Fe3+-hydroxamate transport system substrate-binding protein